MKIIYNAIVILLLLPAIGFSLEETLNAKPTIPVVKTDNVKVVYHINTMEMKDGINKGVYYLTYILDHYSRLGVTDKNLSFIAVFYGDSSTALLKDEFYKKRNGRGGKNPNINALKELVDRGVDIELCGETARMREIKDAELLPNVKVNMGSYVRVIDLQSQGYAYIKF